MSERQGLVIVNTGNGKGKTTAALGTLFRAWGRGLHVGVIQLSDLATERCEIKRPYARGVKAQPGIEF